MYASWEMRLPKTHAKCQWMNELLCKWLTKFFFSFFLFHGISDHMIKTFHRSSERDAEMNYTISDCSLRKKWKANKIMTSRFTFFSLPCQTLYVFSKDKFSLSSLFLKLWPAEEKSMNFQTQNQDNTSQARAENTILQLTRCPHSS